MVTSSILWYTDVMKYDDLLTVQEVASLLGIHENTVYQATIQGRLAYTEAFGRKVITRADAEAYRERTRASGEKSKGRPKGSRSRKQDGEAAGEEAHDTTGV
jgi:excisionase family DNA binding protein